MTMPDTDRAMPPRTTDQKISFWPALKRRAGGCLCPKMPPPALQPAPMSTRSGMLSRIQTTSMNSMPSMNGQDEKVVRVFRPLRKGGEGVRADERHQQALAEDVVEAGEREHDEARRGHPVREALEGVETRDLAAGRIAVLEADAPADQVERRAGREHAEDEEAADPGQRAFAEAAVFAALRLLEGRRPRSPES